MTLTALAGLTACAQTATDQPDIQYATYTLDASKPSVALPPSQFSVWSIENFGPSSVFVRAPRDPDFTSEIKPAAETVTLFAGDPRFSYTIGLGQGGTEARVKIGANEAARQ